MKIFIRPQASFTFVLLGLVLAAPIAQARKKAGVATGAGSMILHDLQGKRKVYYPLLVLNGRAPNCRAKKMSVHTPTGRYQSSVWQGKFRAVGLLQRGNNRVVLRCGPAHRTVWIQYEPLRRAAKVQMVYMIAADGAGRFLAPPGEDNSVASARRRLATAALVMQSANAEALNLHGKGYRTWGYVADRHGIPNVKVLRASKARRQLLSMSGGQLYSYINGQLSRLPRRGQIRYMLIMGFTSYDPQKRKVRGHTALGGGRLALFSAINLHTWPENVGELERRFHDFRRIDKSKLPDDSAGRGTYAGNAATGVGACWHEFGHTLGLPNKGSGIMGRGFDQIHRYFTVIEYSAKGQPRYVGPRDLRGWRTDSVNRVVADRFILLNNKPGLLRVPQDFRTIKAALKRARPGDTVRVAPGRYAGKFAVPAGVTLAGAGAGRSFIVGNRKGNVMSMRDGSRLLGFTITGSGRKSWNSGIWVQNNLNNVIIERNSFKDNVMGFVQYCFRRNNACRASGIVIRNNTFENNREAAVVVYGHAVVTDNRLKSGSMNISLKHKNSVARNNMRYGRPVRTRAGGPQLPVPRAIKRKKPRVFIDVHR